MSENRMDLPLALAPHFNVHLQDDGRILLLSEEGSFRLSGQLYLSLLPHLDGTLSAREIAAIVAKQGAPQDKVEEVLAGMLDKGYAVNVPSPRDMHLNAYWTTQGEVPIDAADSLHSKSVAVVGLGASAAAGAEGAGALQAVLTGSGLEVVGRDVADIVVVMVDDYLQAPVGEIGRELDQAGRGWLPFKPAGLKSWVGPFMGAGAPHTEHPQGKDDDRRPCYECLSRRLLSHRPGDTLLSASEQGRRPARGWTAGSLSLAQGVMASELLRLLRGEDTRLEHYLLTVDTREADIEPHLTPRFEDCPVCGTDGDKAGKVEHTPIRLTERPRGGDGDEGWRALTADEALDRLETIVSPLTGIVPRVESRNLGPGLHIAVANQSNRERLDPRENRRIGKPEGAGGKGVTRTQARVSCLAEAVERYACGWTGTEPRRVAGISELGDAAVHPERLLGFSDGQYKDRDKLNKGADAMHVIPQRFDAKKKVEWSPAWSLTEDAPRWLPTRYCYFNYQAEKVPGDHQFCFGDSNGCASGGNLEEAILQGMLELIERDAISQWWYNRLSLPAADLSGVDTKIVASMEKYCDKHGLVFEVLDLTADLGIPVTATVTARKSDGGAITIGFGAHLDPVVAATRSLTEVSQLLPFNDDGEFSLDAEKFTAAKEWFDTAFLDQHPYLKTASEAAPASLAPGIADVASIDQAVRFCVDRLAEFDLELIVHDFDRKDVPLSAVRTAVPGICHFWNRRGNPRLFEAPVRAGRLDKPLTEDELNPVSFYV